MVKIVKGDITTLAVDAIVNAANQVMLGGGGVDGAIHRAAGRELYEACLKVPEVRPGVRCPTGEARITPGFKLPAKFVIHTVGPVYRDGQHGEPEKLAACYRNSLALAAENGYECSEATQKAVRARMAMAASKGGRAAGNARFVRNLFSATKEHMAMRIMADGVAAENELQLIEPEDLG